MAIISGLAAGGGLLARIGTYGPIWVGDRRALTAPVSGRLYLGVNDDHLPDNRGQFAVIVGVQAAPHTNPTATKMRCASSWLLRRRAGV